MVAVNVKDGKIQYAELQVGEQEFSLPMRKPIPVSRINELEELENKLNAITGESPMTPLRRLWDQCSPYEQAFLRELASKSKVNVAEMLSVYRARGLKSNSGRILAGVTGGIHKKLIPLKIEDLYQADYDGDERVWMMSPKYAAEAREEFRGE
jgi:hypothetical protein